MIRLQWSLRFLLLASFAGVAAAQCSGTSSAVTISASPQYQTVPITVTCSGAGTITGVSVTFNDLNMSGDSLNLNDLGFVLLYQLSSPSTTKFLDFLDAGNSISTGDSYYLTFTDSASSDFPAIDGATVSKGSSGSPATYKPSDYAVGDMWPSPIGTIGSGNAADPPSVDFTTTFEGLTTTEVTGGTWTVYIGNFQGSPAGTIGSIVLNFTTSAGASTTTSISSTPNPSYTSGANSSVTITATVTSSGGTVNGGTVTFDDGGSPLSCSGDQTVSSGTATCVVTLTTQGTHDLTAIYGGTTGFAASGISSTVVQTVVGHTTQTGDTLCNTGPITIPNGTPSTGTGATPYPSYLILGGAEPTLSGIIQKVTLTLTGFDYGTAETVGMLLVAPAANGSACTSSCTAYEFLSNAGGSGLSSAINLTFDDDGSEAVPNPLTTGGTYKPTSAIAGNPPGDGYPTPAPQAFAQAAPNGSATFLGEFGGHSLNPSGAAGYWSLYISNRGSNGTPGSITGGWCLNLTMETGADATATAVSGTPNPATTGGSVNLTATVTDTSNGTTVVNAGSVEFTDGSTTLGTVSVVDGQASLSVTSLAEGTHHILASYGGGTGTATFGVSSASYDQRINNATTASGTNPYSFCNTGVIAVPATPDLSGAAGPYPSNIFVTNLPGTVDAMTVELKGFSAHSTVNDIGSLLVGPGGGNLDFFSNAGGVGSLTTAVNLIFQDGSTPVPSTLTAGGTFAPTSDSPKDSYPTCPPNATDCASPPVGPPMTVTSFNYASTNGSSVFGDATTAGIFGGTASSTFNGNGTWSLYMVAPSENEGNISIATGWCVNLTENPVGVSVNRVYSSFEQGQSGSIQVTVTNSSGPGSTGDPSQGGNPLTVVDTLPAGFTYSSFTGTNWSCSNSSGTVTCTNDSSVADTVAYPVLTIDVTVASNAATSLSNHVTTSGAGTTATSNTDTLTIEAETTTVAGDQTATFSASNQSVTLSAMVTSGAGTVSAGTVTFTVLNGVTPIGSPTSPATVTSGAASASYTLPAGTPAGTYTIDASYSGGGNFGASSDTTHTLTVNAAGTTTAAANVSTNFSSSTQSVGLSATVTSAAGTVNAGTVTFTLLNASSQIVGTATTSAAITSGTASVNYSLPASQAVGTYTIQAVYNGSTNFTGSTDTSHTLTILSVAPALTVVSFNVVFGSVPEVYNVTTSSRTRLPWDITAIQVVFSEPVAGGNAGSLGGLTATGFSGLGTNTLTWTISPVSIGSFTATLAASGGSDLTDASGNSLNNGTQFSQAFKVLWGDVNDDGVVNAVDLALILSGEKQPYNIFADMNGDGAITVADYTIAHGQLGTSQP